MRQDLVALLSPPRVVKLPTLLVRGYRFRATFATAARVTAKLSVSAANARRLKLGTGETLLGTVTRQVAAGTTTLTVKVRAPAKRKLRRLKRVPATLRVTAVDATGQRRVRTLAVTIKRS